MSSNTNIGNTPVNQGYVQLIHMGETGGIDGTLRALYDGDGTASDLLIASDKVKISTELYIGSKTLTEFVQDTVGAMFSSNTETNITVTYQDGDGTIDLVSSGEVTLTGSETLTNKTLTSPVINTGISGSAILDEDNMASNSATKLSTQQSIKAYVDAEVAGVVDTAPAALNTLNELAAALGDDANFATTTATSLGEKLVKSSNLSDLTNAGTARSNLGLGSVATLSSIAVSNLTASAIQISSESFADNDTTIMTSAAINDRIESFGYSTTTGTVTNVSVGSGLDVSNSTTTPSITLDLTELADMTEGVVSADELILLDGSTLKRKAISEITLSTFSDSGFNHGAITALNNATANELVTVGSTTTELDAEANLTFDGTTLNVNGDLKVGVGADGQLTSVNNGLAMRSLVSNADMFFYVNDGGVDTLAMKIDGSDVGSVLLPNDLQYLKFGVGGDGILYSYQDDFWIQNVTQDQDIKFRVNDGGVHTDALFIQGSTTNVGIGTTSPASPLNVKSNSSSSSDSGITITQNGGSNAIFKMAEKSTDGGRFHMYDGGVEKIAFYTDGTANHISAGNVGIGTTSPDGKLHIVGNSDSVAALKLGSNADHGFSFFERSTEGDLRIKKEVNGTLADVINIARSDGDVGFYNNVGIGTVSPSKKLEVAGGFRISETGDGTDYLEIGVGADATTGGTSVLTNNGSMVFGTTDSSSLIVRTNNTEAMRIDSSGRLVVGHTAAIATVGGTGHSQVLGTGGSDSLLTIGRFSANAGAPQINFAKSRNGTIGGNTIVQDGDSCGEINWCVSDGSDMISYIAQVEAEVDGTPGSNDTPGRLMFKTTADGGAGATEAMRIDSSQDAHFDQDVIAFSTTPSDIRLKKNFTKIENGLDVVNKLEGHTFNWKKGGERLSAGFKAQEVEKILPHLVDEKKLPLKADDDKEYKILRYEEMIPYLVEAIKEQQDQINELKGIING